MTSRNPRRQGLPSAVDQVCTSSVPGKDRAQSPELEVLTYWMGRVRAADKRALSQLLDVLFSIISRIMRNRLWRWAGAADDANDIAQETVIRVASHLADCRATDGGQLLGWASRIAQRLMLDLLRSSSFRYERSWRLTDRDAESALEVAAVSHWAEERASQWAEEQVSDWVTELAARAAGRSDRSQRHQAHGAERRPPDIGEPVSAATRLVGRQTVLRAAYAVYLRSPEAVAELLWRHLIEGATWAELGDELGTTAGGAKRRYQRAQAALRRAVVAKLETLPDAERIPAEALLTSWGRKTMRGNGRPARSRRPGSDKGTHRESSAPAARRTKNGR